MNIRITVLFVLLFYAVMSSCQTNYKLGKDAEAMLKSIRTEGWKTITADEDPEAQFTTWHRLETESFDRYCFAFAESEAPSLKQAEQMATIAARNYIMSLEKSEHTSNASVEESSATRGDGSSESHSDVMSNEKARQRYMTTDADFRQVLSIYRKVGNMFQVQKVLVKEYK